MMLDLLMEWGWWIFPIVGTIGAGKRGLNPFSDKFSRSESGSTTQGSVPDPNAQEQRQLDRFESLSKEQQAAILEGIGLSRQPVSFQSLGLSSADQATLDEAYAGAEANLRRQAGLLGQDLASTRGLNMSDTPVSEVVMREFMPASMQLQSARAQQGLGLGLNMRQLGENARQFKSFARLNSTGSIFSLR
jgi:hypothetical protein